MTFSTHGRSSQTADDGLSVMSDSDHANQPLSERYWEQFNAVHKIVSDLGTFSEDKINQIMDQYYNTLGLNEYYFQTSTPPEIAHNMVSVMAAKILHEKSGSDYFPVIERYGEDKAFIILRTSLLNRKSSQNYMVERDIEARYFRLEESSKTLWRMQCFRSTHSIFDEPDNVFERLRTYFFQKPVFDCEHPNPKELDLSKLLDRDFYENKKHTITEQIYYRLNKQVVESETGIGIATNLEPRDGNVYRLDIAFKREYMHSDFYSRMGDIITLYGWYSKSKYFDPLSNGVCIFTAFLTTLPESQLSNPETPLDVRAKNLLNAIKLSLILPNNNYLSLVMDRKLEVHEAVYAYCVSRFIEHFSGSIGPHVALIEKFASREQISPSELYEIRSKLKIPPYMPDQIFRACSRNVTLIKRCYQDFRKLHDPELNPNGPNENIEKDTIAADIKSLENREHIDILSFFIKFNNFILRTNFFLPDKLSISFRFDPSYLSATDYLQRPYSVVQILGPHFIGFHIRFGEIARGGIRIVQSYSQEAFTRNKLQVFDEAYNLSYTQSLKNKDIPEDGAKGVILLDMAQKKEVVANYTRSSFISFVDGLLDLMLPSKYIVDRLQQEEMYFLGPDENTGAGGLMDFASMYAKTRGCPHWRAFTTGKEPEMGGIPHDLYGMTTSSIEAFIQELLKKFGLEERNVTRFLTGGPDGDLGSNALLVSNTKTLTMIDKSGVLHDPQGLNIDELRRLANLRLKGQLTCCMMYDQKLLSPNGFMVSEDAVNISLPDGTLVKRGAQFRDEFHLGGASADLFNPCGGRPSSITTYNVNKLFFDNGKCVFKFVVEGANVYITQDARRFLESKGVILFKDASTNKGGVTSSSLEVLAALVLDDATFCKHFTRRPDGTIPEFRRKYIEETIEIIKENARLEFHALWDEGQRTGKPRCDLTDVLSSKILNLKKSIMASDSLFSDDYLVKVVLECAVPKSLQALISLQDIQKRLPQNYLRAFFASHVASKFYYTQHFSDDTSVFSFYDYINTLKCQT
ncbi:bifunctional NAD-glutamate dehydrogenase/NAD(P)-binding domain superfamily/Aminoacid dehydrogenase-like [Babesia duncani]|uniref:Bifunctional NAD-glutamate dehydrogenase/NAD(P)-binding domain superfamily/Aminoacid dehydrogenase-like n=1 Tax=Babesia duncani TaxID=323732 RepID=A0AAD9PK34_9APIC|nr:bifunctional NAD-glutamate dehydrogenase/NAD(P)-binding domain superfamily/Aminoacid dehydrogenase-like [Babesia duncani]